MEKKFIIFFCMLEVLVIVYILSFFFKPISADSLTQRGLKIVGGNGFNYYEPIDNIAVKDYMFGIKTYITNSDGIYSNKEYAINKPQDTFRILTLGDSFTFGSHVDTENNWPSQLEKKLNQEKICNKFKIFEVINLGVEGYDSQYSVQRYKDKGEQYKPDLVIWMHTDLIRQNSLMSTLISQKTKMGQDPLTSWTEARRALLTKYGEEKIYTMQKQIITSLDEYFDGELGFIISSSVDESGKKLLSNIVQNRGNSFLLSIPDLKVMGGLLRENSHPNEKGHKIISNTVYSFLKQNNIICKD